MRKYTFKQLEEMFDRSKDVTRQWIDRFAIIKKREKANGKTKVVYLLDSEKIKEIMVFKDKMDAKIGYKCRDIKVRNKQAGKRS